MPLRGRCGTVVPMRRASRAFVAGSCVLVGLAWLASGCIVSLGGLTGGGEDSGSDVTVDVTEAGADAGGDTAPTRDTGSPGPEAGKDASTCHPPALPDAGPPPACPVMDAALPPDAGAREGGPATDASPAVTCSPVDLPNFPPAWIPPSPQADVCTSGQAAMVFTCLTSNSTACQDFVADAGNTPCIGCMVSANTASTFGPVEQIAGGVFVLNIGGCVALADPCLMQCAEIYQEWTTCHVLACASCPLENGLGPFEACTMVADTCACAPLAAQLNTCITAILESPAADCLASASNPFASAGEFATRFFCE